MKKVLANTALLCVGAVTILSFQNCKQSDFETSLNLGEESLASEVNAGSSESILKASSTLSTLSAVEADEEIDEVMDITASSRLTCKVSAPSKVNYASSIDIQIQPSSVIDQEAKVVVAGYRSFSGMSQAWKFASVSDVSAGAVSINVKHSLFGTAAHMPGPTSILVRLVDKNGQDLCDPSRISVVESVPSCNLEPVNSQSSYRVGDDVILCMMNNSQLPWGFNMAEVYGTVNGVDNISANIASGAILNRLFTSKIIRDNSTLPARYASARCYKFDVNSNTAKGLHKRNMKLYYAYTSVSDFTSKAIQVCETNSVEYVVE